MVKNKTFIPSLLTRGNKILPLHAPIVPTIRLCNRTDSTRLPYSAALAGVDAVCEAESVAILSSSSLVTQTEPSSSSVNGEKGDTATISTSHSGIDGVTPASIPSDESVSVYIAKYVYSLARH
jgi:hypothetical protein